MSDYLQIVRLRPDELHAFRNHPFKVRDDAEMASLISSIERNGIISPITVRKMGENGYEIVSGHRRTEAARRLELETVPAIIREFDDDDAILAMIDSNLNQQPMLLPSERAFAYRMKRDVFMRRKESHPANTRIRDIVAEEFGTSSRQVTRFIRLSYLREGLLELLDQRVLSIAVGVSVSYLNASQQAWIETDYTENKRLPNARQAREMKLLADGDNLTRDAYGEIMAVDYARPPDAATAFFTTVREEYLPDMSDDEVREYLIDLLRERQYRNRGYR